MGRGRKVFEEAGDRANEADLCRKSGRIKKTVLMLLKSNLYAGAEKVAMSIMQYFEQEYTFYYASPEGAIANRLKRESCPYLSLTSFRLQEIQRVIRVVQPDIIHAHDFSASVAAALLKGWNGTPKVISHLHYNARENRRWGKKALLYQIALRRLDTVICVSEAIVEEAVFRRGLQSKVKILGNPVKKDEIWRLAMQGEPNEASYRFDVLFVGRLSKQKNPQKFIRILARLKQEGKPVYAALVGEGEERNACEALVQMYQLEPYVTWLGFLENPYPVMKRSKILCMTSREEGFGLAVAEAMVLGLPVLTAEVGGMRQLLGAEAEAFCKTEQEYVTKIRRLLEDPQCYQREQKKMEKRAENFLDLPEYMEQIRAIYQTW